MIEERYSMVDEYRNPNLRDRQHAIFVMTPSSPQNAFSVTSTSPTLSGSFGVGSGATDIPDLGNRKALQKRCRSDGGINLAKTCCSEKHRKVSELFQARLSGS